MLFNLALFITTSISHFRCLTLSETVWVCIFVPRTKYRSYHQEIKTLKTIRLNASYVLLRSLEMIEIGDSLFYDPKYPKQDFRLNKFCKSYRLQLYLIRSNLVTMANGILLGSNSESLSSYHGISDIIDHQLNVFSKVAYIDRSYVSNILKKFDK
uniref:Uncharacterized protein n=1 Tax=Rhizophagus irregularis (strain DAOM 181602 / DAOM 197198 / MUCL 43194) TaxID=747089 RepID=U9SKF4_RHIID